MSYSHPPANPLNRPLSVGDWIIVFFLLSIPVVGFILIIYWSFADDVNINKKNFSKASLLIVVITFALVILLTVLFGHLISTFDINNFNNPRLI